MLAVVHWLVEVVRPVAVVDLVRPVLAAVVHLVLPRKVPVLLESVDVVRFDDTNLFGVNYFFRFRRVLIVADQVRTRRLSGPAKAHARWTY